MSDSDILDTIIYAANEAIENDCETDRWEDPGVYPSGAGSGPLPSYDYIVPPEEVEIVVACTEDPEWLIGENWSHRVYGAEAELELRCEIKKISHIGPGEIAVLISVKDR